MTSPTTLTSPSPSATAPEDANIGSNGGKTQHTFDRFKSRYALTLTKEAFIGLCAYLNSLLVWGFEASTVDLDGFIVCYTVFESGLQTLYTQHASVEQWQLPAYHQWLKDPETLGQRLQTFDPATASAQGLILTEAALREIWTENFFHFLWVEMSLQRIAVDAVRNEE
jgi:hypothetical protein